jgi:hypothetical protein
MKFAIETFTRCGKEELKGGEPLLPIHHLEARYASSGKAATRFEH